MLLPETYVGVAQVTLAGVTPQTYNLHFAQSESDLVRSSYVLKQVVTSLDLSKRWSKKYNQGETLTDTKTAALMADMLEIHAIPNVNLLRICFYDNSAEEAAEVANKIAETYRAFPQGHCGEIIDRATPQSQPIRPNRPLNIIVGVLAGCALGIFSAVVVGLFSLWRLRAARPVQPPEVAPKPDRFWRRFAVVMACVILIPVVVAIIGILAAIAIPAFVKGRNRAQAVAAHNQRALAKHNSEIFFDHVGKTWFPKGDSIEILSVERSEDEMKVKGLYNLISANNARLALYVTSTNDIATTEADTQSTLIAHGTGDFELVYPHRVSGLPHVTMYAADGKGFAEVYFGSKDEAAAESKLELGSTNALLASVETWSPPLAPGEKPDLQKILQDATKLMEVGHFEEALQHHLWYHRHALEYDPGQTGVRLSFALSDWVELGRHYPKAKQALVEIRDHRTQELLEGRGHSEMFSEVEALNRELQKPDDTYALFKKLETRDPQLAGQCYFWVEGALVQKGEYETCRRHLGDPQRRFEIVQRSWKQMKVFEDQSAARRREQSERYKAMAKTNSAYTSLASTFDLPAPPPYADRHFIEQTRQLIEILVATDHKADAEQIRSQALAILDDAQLKSAVTDAEQKTAGRTGKP